MIRETCSKDNVSVIDFYKRNGLEKRLLFKGFQRLPCLLQQCFIVSPES
jgi:hypothetical protein